MKETVHINCPVCHKDRPHHTVFNMKDSMYRMKDSIRRLDIEYACCTECSHIYMKNRPSDEFLDEFYNKAPHENPTLNAEPDNVRAEYIVDSIGEIKGEILDIGCFTGRFLDAVKNDNTILYGIEPSSSAAEIISKDKPYIKLFNGLFSPEIPMLRDKNFSLVSMIHVFEHIGDSSAFIKQIKKLDFEYLFIEVPNFHGRFLKWGLKEKTHLNYFTETSLLKVLTDNELYPIMSDNIDHGPVLRVIAEKRENEKKVFNYDLTQEIKKNTEILKKAQIMYENLKKYRKERIENNIRHFKDKRIFLYGAGTDAFEYIDILRGKGLTPCALVDSNRDILGGNRYHGLDIISIDQVENISENIVIVTPIYKEENIKKSILKKIPQCIII